jgi:hypothetical protein
MPVGRDGLPAAPVAGLMTGPLPVLAGGAVPGPVIETGADAALPATGALAALVCVTFCEVVAGAAFCQAPMGVPSA